MPIQYGSLEISEDMAFQRRSWTAERIGWGLMTAGIVAALLGLFSSGPLSSTVAEAAGGAVRVHYDYFQRSGAAADMRIDIAQAPAQGEVTVRLSRSLVEAIEIDQIQPPPARAESGSGGLTFAFPVAAAPASIFIWGTANTLGRVSGEVAVGDARVPVSAFV